MNVVPVKVWVVLGIFLAMSITAYSLFRRNQALQIREDPRVEIACEIESPRRDCVATLYAYRMENSNPAYVTVVHLRWADETFEPFETTHPTLADFIDNDSNVLVKNGRFSILSVSWNQEREIRILLPSNTDPPSSYQLQSTKPRWEGIHVIFDAMEYSIGGEVHPYRHVAPVSPP